MFDVIIIGAGPAGMTAALYALRSGKMVMVLESDGIGGQIANSPRVENYPSIKQISGSDLSSNMYEQILDLGAVIELEQVINVEKTNEGFNVTTEYGQYDAKSVVIATGAKHRTLGLPLEDELVGKGVSYCAVCDGAFYKNEDVAVIGDANSALQYVLHLANYTSHIYLCMLFDQFFADKALIEQVEALDKVEIIKTVSLQEFLVDDNNELKGLRFVNTNNNEDVTINVKGCFIAIGQVPDNRLFKSLVDLNEQGYIKASENCMTKTPGLFVAGDTRTKGVRQLSTAISDGAVAALQAVKYLNTKK